MEKNITTKKPEVSALSRITGFSDSDIRVFRSTVAKNTTDDELLYFLKFAKGLKLNPLNKEI